MVNAGKKNKRATRLSSSQENKEILEARWSLTPFLEVRPESRKSHYRLSMAIRTRCLDGHLAIFIAPSFAPLSRSACSDDTFMAPNYGNWPLPIPTPRIRPISTLSEIQTPIKLSLTFRKSLTFLLFPTIKLNTDTSEQKKKEEKISESGSRGLEIRVFTKSSGKDENDLLRVIAS